MAENRIRGALLLVGTAGIGVTSWLMDARWTPGIVGALLMAAALGVFSSRRGPHK